MSLRSSELIYSFLNVLVLEYGILTECSQCRYCTLVQVAKGLFLKLVGKECAKTEMDIKELERTVLKHFLHRRFVLLGVGP
jgi:hypothetical protein